MTYKRKRQLQRDVGCGQVPGKLVGLIGGDLAEGGSPSLPLSLSPPIPNVSQLVSVFSPPFVSSPAPPAWLI